MSPLAGLLAALLLVPAGAAAQLRADPAETARQIVAQTNALRRAQGLPNTVPHARLTDIAHGFAQYMAQSDRYGHEADGRTPAERAKAQGYDYCVVLENIAYQYSSAGFRSADLATRTVGGWERSPGHRRNMLDRDVTETGVAVVQSPRSGRYYAVQMFGRPRTMHTAFRIANRSNTTLRYELGGETFRLQPRVTRTHEQCRAEPLIVQLPGVGPTELMPGNGDRYTVERAGQGYRVVKG